MPTLTKRTVDAAKPGDDVRIVWDDKIAGFGLVVRPSGVKSFVFNYRSPEGRTRRITLGKHGVLTAEQARKLAREKQHAVTHGDDPLERRQEQRRAVTVEEILDAYLASDAFTDKAETTKVADLGRINRHLRPLLGKRYAHRVTEQDVRRAFNAIRDGKTSAKEKTSKKRGLARVRGGPGAAREAIVRLGIIFNWAISSKLMKENPCRFIKLDGVGTRDAIIEDADEYARVFKTLDAMQEGMRIRPEAADAIRLIALTGCRRNEAAGLRWRHVDLKQNRIVLPAREHKAGKRTGKPRTIALAGAAQAIIARQLEGGPDDLVFRPARATGGPIELSHVWAKVRDEAKLPKAVTLHALRHSTASHMAMAGAEASQIMAALGHSQMSTVVRYIHFAKSARDGLADKAAAVALAGMSQGSVVPLKKKRAAK